MTRFQLTGAILAAALAVSGGMAGGFASAQDASVLGAAASGPGKPGSVAGLNAVSVGPKLPGGAPTGPTPASGEATALEKAQNALRAKEGRSPLGWSALLAAEAEAGAVRATESVCTLTATLKAQAPGSTNVYWSAPTRRMDGASTSQNLLPGFVVSEWRSGRADYDPVTGKCRQPGLACEAFVRMMSAEHKSVGCAVKTCPNQAQVYICRYGK